MFKSLIVACTLALFLTSAYADEAKLPRTMSLSGHGEVRMAPDLAIVTVGA